MINKLNHNIKMFTKVMTFLMILNLVNFVNGIKCTNVAKNRTFHSMECTDVTSMHELTSAMKSTWTSLRIINPIGSSFAISEHVNRNLGIIQDLDLSSAGSVLIGDNFGFREFSALQHINLSNSKLAGINNNWFATQNNILTLNLSYNRISSLTRQNFNTLTNLKTLDLSYNFLNTIQLAFIQLINLEWLSLNHNQLQELVDMGDLPMLKYLDLSENAIAEIRSNAFKNKTSLQTVNLSQNLIRSIGDGSFSGLANIQMINLFDNSIAKLTRNQFQGLDNVQLLNLNLRQNRIENIQKNSFGPLNYLESLDLSRNSLRQIENQTFKGLPKLRYLYLQENDVLEIHPKAFNNLIDLYYLDLSKNNLQTLSGHIFGTTKKILQLQKLFVNNNKLDSIDVKTFENTPKIDLLTLAGNQLTKLPEKLLGPLLNLKKLHLHNNLLEELPEVLFDKSYELIELLIHQNRLTFFQIVNEYTFPQLQKMSFEGNPWQCACLNNLFDFVTQRNITYFLPDNPYYSGMKPICIVTASKTCITDLNYVKLHQIIENFFVNI